MQAAGRRGSVAPASTGETLPPCAGDANGETVMNDDGGGSLLHIARLETMLSLKNRWEMVEGGRRAYLNVSPLQEQQAAWKRSKTQQLFAQRNAANTQPFGEEL